MKINESQPIKRINPYTQQSYNEKGIMKSDKYPSKKDEVSISDEALQMAQITDPETAIENSKANSRMDHINEIKQSIQEGTYNPDTREVARKIYDSFSK